MSVTFATALLSAGLAIIVGWALPALAMWMLVPSLEASSAKVRNYRGVDVASGLGVVWPVWAVLVLVVTAKTLFFTDLLGALDMAPWVWWAVPAVMVPLTFAFGLVDDAFGTADAKGFRGHLKAMAGGRLTTGGLKLIGIGLVAAVAALAARAVAGADAGQLDWRSVAGWVFATLTIALAANLVNLTDLRPGRALKVYSLLVVLAVPGLVVSTLAASSAGTLAGAGWPLVAVSVPLALGPVVAVWGYDLGERAMLGDAGANAMGALAGYLFAATLPLWGLVVTTVVLGTLNVLSEKVSFSKVIEASAALRWIDGLGRAHGAASEAGTGHEQAGEGVAAPSGKRHEADTRKDGAQ